MFCVTQGRSVLRVALFLFAALRLLAQDDALADKSHQAKELMAAGRFAEAVPLYQDLLRALPANTGLRLNLALAYHMSGQHKAAIPEFERVLKADPNNLPALMSLSMAQLELNQPAKAIPSLQKLIAMEPANTNVRGMLANALLSLDRAQEASTHFRKLTAQTPNDPKAWYGLGRSYESLAGKTFEELNRSSQGSPEWLALVADSRMERKQYRSAFFFYKEALQKKPDFPGLHSSLAELYRRSEHPDWAETESKKEKGISRADCLKNKQACDFMAGRFVEAASGTSLYWKARAYNELALGAFKQLGKLPESVELHAIKAEILSGHQQFLEAAQEWNAARQFAPEDPRLERQWATALYQAGDYEKAMPTLRKLLQQEPGAPDLNFFVGDSFLRSEQAEQAVPYLETAVKADAGLLPAQASLGLAYIRTGKEAEAIPHLLAALPLDDDGNLHFQLARAYQRAGEAEKAKEAMAKYREIQQRSEAEKRNLEEKAVITGP